LCDAMQCRLEDGDAAAEDWTDSNGNSLRPDRIWKYGIEDLISADDAGPCMGIELMGAGQSKQCLSDYGTYWHYEHYTNYVFPFVGETSYCAHIGWRRGPARGI
jgi:hypothetical protein